MGLIGTDNITVARIVCGILVILFFSVLTLFGWAAWSDAQRGLLQGEAARRKRHGNQISLECGSTMSELTNDYFCVREVNYANGKWTYVAARKILLIVYGITAYTRKLVLIRQYRPPMERWVISAPMGCFQEDAPSALLPIAAREAEAETGHRVLKIRPLLEFARSPGMTTERALCFVACYADEATSQDLHPDEQIEVVYTPVDPAPNLLQPPFASGDILDSSTLLCGPWLTTELESVRREALL